jgi:hypothetical protein
LIIIAGMGGDLTDQPGMTSYTVFLQNSLISWFYPNRFVEILQGKPFGVPKTIFRFS